MGRDEEPDTRRFGWASAVFAKLVALAGRVGADPRESSDAALQRLVMVLLAVGTLPMTILWSVIYLAAGAPLAAAAPAVYSVATPIFVLNLGSVIAIAFALLYYFVAQRNFFQERSETLLLNILPKEISDALKVDRSAIAAHYESASVLFADVVGFTPMAAAMIPLRLVNLLNEVFSGFDDLVEKHGLEKIQDDRRLLYGRRRRASRAGRPRARSGAARSRHP